MSTIDRSHSPDGGSPNVADLNIERLLNQAYRPDTPAADLLPRVQERMCATASTASHARPTVHVAATPEQPGLNRVRVRLGIVMALAASLAGVALLMHGLHLASRTGDKGNVASKGDPNYTQPGNAEILTPRKRPEMRAPQKLAIGHTVETAAGDRGRFELPDGSILFVNQSTRIVLNGDRTVTLERGEVFVEVAPRGKSAQFVVKTPRRDVTALGTKFAVKANDAGTGVVVTQGKVKVSGIDGELITGQRLEADKVEPAPRATAVLDWTRELMAAAESPLVPDSKYTGGALIAKDPNGQEAKLNLRNYKVDVHIEDGFARTIIDQTYFNQNHWRMEGTFYFPLPADAQLSRLSMYVDGVLMEGGMAERNYAQRVYDDIVTSQKDPALLEWVDGSTFKMRVFPLEARQEKRIIIGYTQRIPSLYGRSQYRFPAGHSLGLVNKWEFDAKIKHGAALALSCDSHKLEAKQVGDDMVLRAREKNARLDRDVVLNLVDPTGGMSTRDAMQFSGAMHEGHRYMMLRYRPQMAVQQQRQSRDWVFLFEASGDRDPLLARTQIEVIRTLLANAEHYDTFAIVSAGTRVRTFRDKPVLVTAENVKAALEFLEQSHLIGALDLGQAINACEGYLKAGPNPHLVHVGTGIAAMGERRPDELARRIPAGTRYVGVGVGRRWSRDLMKAAAEKTGGHFTQINPDETVSWRAFELSATLNTPRLMNIKAASGSRTPWLVFGTALAHGEELCAIVRMDATETPPTSVTITGSLDGKPFEQEIEVPRVAGQADYVPRAWAKLEIDRMLAENSRDHREAIVKLSKEMYVMSPFTSLLVLENEAMYKQFKVDRGRKDHWAQYQSPDTIAVMYEPEIGTPVDARSRPKTEKPHTNEILQTVVVRVPAPILAWPNRNDNRHGRPWLTALEVYHGAFAMPCAPVAGESQGDGGGWNAAPGLVETEESAKSLGDAPVNINRIGDAVFAGADKDNQATLAAAAPFARDGEQRRALVTRTGSTRLREPRAGRDERGELNQVLLIVDDLKQKQAQMKSLNDFVERDLKPDAKRQPISLQEAKEKQTKEVLDYLVSGRSQGPRMYGRPGFSHQERVFFDLASYAPGMTTSLPDIQAVTDAEALPEMRGLPGTVDSAARKLIDKARTAGWRKLTVGAGKDAYTILFDGQGRYAYQRTLTLGLNEQVICDGKTIVHLYPELGIGARRTVSRFHRAQFAEQVPWLVLPAEDLARGSNVKTVNDHTISVIPRDAEDARDDNDKPLPYRCFHLVFAADGSLAERLIIEVSADRATSTTLYRETYDPSSGTVTLFNPQNEVLSKRELKVAAGTEPALAAETSKLVVLPMPYRTADHAYSALGVKRNNLFSSWESWTYEYLDQDSALALFAAEFGVNDAGWMRRLYDVCFSANGQRKAGFFTLMASAGMQVASHPDFVALCEANPSDPLLGFLAVHSNPTYRKLHQRWGVYQGDSVGAKGSFLNTLSRFHDLHARWTSGDLNRGSHESRRPEQKRALEFVKENRSVFGWALLTVVQDRAETSEFRREVAEAYRTFEDASDLGYAARYEHARSLLYSGQPQLAAAHFRKLYEDMSAEGSLPVIDGSFREALQSDVQVDQWTALIRASANKLLAAKRRTAVITLAWQCHQLGDGPLAENLVAAALRDLTDDTERLQVSVTALDYLVNTGQYGRADSLLSPLLEHGEFSKRPMLWRLGSQIAQRRSLTARSIACLERALEREYHHLPEVINLRQVRSDYGQLLNHYDWLAGAVATMNIDPPKDLLARTVRAADRWRALDRESEQPSELAAKVLKTLGARELAWEYLTTPIALKPNEGGPWQNLAQRLSYQADYDLANLAFKAAFESDPTDANILWEQAQTLRRAGKLAESQQLLRQIVNGTWPTRFNWLQSQARWQLEGR
ncbi:MAG: FecR domain-containing protein [Gemmataceae bacterium]|nr:FecR domain-containing protein [Gemmataceae bacterium]